jgi:peptidoglycan/LPS O-acetylase OafA/YrhL
LRAVAVLPVLLFHAGFKPFAKGVVGVDILFAISGYLFTAIIVLEMARGAFSFAGFLCAAHVAVWELQRNAALAAHIKWMFSTIANKNDWTHPRVSKQPAFR